MTDARAPEDKIYLNTADPEALRRFAPLADGAADALIEARPFHDWNDLGRVDGFDQDRIDAIRAAGGELGEPAAGPIGEPGSGGSGGSPAGNMGRA